MSCHSRPVFRPLHPPGRTGGFWAAEVRGYCLLKMDSCEAEDLTENARNNVRRPNNQSMPFGLHVVYYLLFHSLERLKFGNVS